MKIYDFTLEYQREPKGLGVKKPRFSWKLESEERNVLQAAYHLWVFSDGKPVWDSGRMDSAQSVLIPYGGLELSEETEYQVHLAVEDNHGSLAEADTVFSTGIYETAHFRQR